MPLYPDASRPDASRPDPSAAPRLPSDGAVPSDDDAPTRRIPRLQLDPVEYLDTSDEVSTRPLGGLSEPGAVAPVIGLGRRLAPEQEELLARLTSRRPRHSSTAVDAAGAGSDDGPGSRADSLADTTTFAPLRSRSDARRGTRRTRPLLARVALTAGAFLLTLVASAGAVVAYTYQKYNGQIHRVAVLQTKDPNIREASKQLHAANFLILGSDTRAGADASYGNVAGARSDTSIIVHLSPDHTKATVISIPRDSWVTIPTCKTANGSVQPQHQDMFNSAFTVGGPSCTIATVQKLTGIEITHFVEIDFSGFKDIVNALGKITVCSPQAVSDANSGLHLRPGNNTLDGTQALAYVRARESLGDGSDLGRIKRQQMFLGDVLRKALDGSMLSNLGKLTSFLDAATKAITVDKKTTFGDLRTLATSMQGLDPARVRFYTAPIANSDYTPPGTDMSGRVLLDPTKGRVLYDSVINDHKPVTVKIVNGKTITPSKPAPTTPTKSTGGPSANFDAGQKTCSL